MRFRHIAYKGPWPEAALIAMPGLSLAMAETARMSCPGTFRRCLFSPLRGGSGLPFVVLVSWVILTSCHQMRVVPIPARGRGLDNVTTEARSKTYLMGLVEGKTARAECREGMQDITVKRGFKDSIIHFWLGGVVSTRSIEVVCNPDHLDLAHLQQDHPLDLQAIRFDSGGAILQDGSLPLLNDLADYLKKNPGRRILIAGHTDTLGGNETFKEGLSHRRAEAVKTYLISKGIPPSRMETRGYGSSKPVAPGNDPYSSSLNRRIEITVMPTQVGPAPVP